MQRERNQVLREVINNLFQAARKKLAFPAVEVRCWGFHMWYDLDWTHGVLLQIFKKLTDSEYWQISATTLYIFKKQQLK